MSVQEVRQVFIVCVIAKLHVCNTTSSIKEESSFRYTTQASSWDNSNIIKSKLFQLDLFGDTSRASGGIAQL